METINHSNKKTTANKKLKGSNSKLVSNRVTKRVVLMGIAKGIDGLVVHQIN